MTSFKMLLFLFFLHLIKSSQRNVNTSHYDYIYFFLFTYISSDFLFMYLCFFVVRCLMVYVYFLHELYLLSLKIFIFISFKISRFFKINQRFNTINVNMKTI